MVQQDKVLVFDIDGTICSIRKENQSYMEVQPDRKLILKIKEYHKNGFYIILYTSRQMKTYDGNIGKINANTGKILFEWLEKYEIPFDEIYFGKPWCGKNGFYIDDKAIRPSEFKKLDYASILKLLEEERNENNNNNGWNGQ